MKITQDIIIGHKYIKKGEYTAGELSAEDIKVCESLGAVEKSDVPSVKELLSLIDSCNTIAEVETLTRNEPRKKVIDAAADRIKALEAALIKKAEDAPGGEAVTMDQIIAEIDSKDLETELDLLLSEIEMEGLTQDEIDAINAAADKCRAEILAGLKG